MDFKSVIGNVPDFPKPGIIFRDITPLLAHPRALGAAIEALSEEWAGKVDVIAALDARGFIFGSPLAFDLGLPFVPIRKKGKLPGKTVSVSYSLEYGIDTIEIKDDGLLHGLEVLIVDDLLATGGTARAACELIEKVGGIVSGCAFVIEIEGLGGRGKLAGRTIHSLAIYEEEKVLA